ncbi:FHA domain-containing protein [Streptomyces sp. N2-109]|uniref:FHA domain-containing protein n=1 Tax=Streptomyces gossypii TaxID=2883101 RepID=A0ABT2JSN7_9ACTN|nr:DUF1707 and FHA domain-containing protein [Streptomyces gossypii]MCT2590887.1 FHA domain-containing protein [Streptomyces gossypii]
MTSLEFRAYPPRVSDADRERALEVLRESAVEGRISQDTFLRRMEVILQVQRYDELEAAVQDLRTRRRGTRWVFRTVGALSAFPVMVRRAWQTERLPELLLPAPGPYALSIGRAPGSVLRLNDFTVSRTHAQLRHTDEGWTLRDLGSSNGTWVNGRRVTGKTRVWPGDQVRFGQVGYRLTAP